MVPRLSSRDRRIFGETLKSARLGTPEAQYEVGLMYANGIGVDQDIAQAVHWVSQAAQRGMAAAQYLLATRFESGIGVEQNAHLAALWFAKAAEQGHAKAHLRLGVLYGKPHPEQALRFLRTAADAGLPAAQHALANACMHGQGMAVDTAQAALWYEAAARQGVADAQFALGDILQRGLTSPPDLEGALYWFRKAARQDHLAAQVAIERMERDGHQVSTLRGLRGRKSGAADRRRKEGRWIHAAESGNADDRYHMGLMYEQGMGVESDSGAARYWYGLAAQQGHTKAQLALGRLSEMLGLPDALKWYSAAADGGEAQAQFALGTLLASGTDHPRDPLAALGCWVKAAHQDHTEALVHLGKWLQADAQHAAAHAFWKAATLGDAQAQYLLGQYLAQEEAPPIPTMSALEWYEKAAHQGHSGGQYALGVAYLRGQGFAKNPKLALKWFLQSAEQGDARAQWNVGLMYTTGVEGLQRDLKLAFQWFQRSADQGFVAALSNLGILYALTGLPERAAAAWKQAAEHDDPEALYNLALAYLKGQGVEKDEEQALSLLSRAAERGLVAAQSRLGLMYATGEGAVLDPIECVKWLTLAADGHDAAAQANLERALTLHSAKHIAEGQRRAKAWKSLPLSSSGKQGYR